MNTQMTTATDIAYKAVGDYLLPMIGLPESFWAYRTLRTAQEGLFEGKQAVDFPDHAAEWYT